MVGCAPIRRFAASHRAAMCIAATIVAVPLLALAYESFVRDSYSATARIKLLAGGPDSAIKSTPLSVAQLETYVATLKSLPLAEIAAQQLSVQPGSRPALVRIARQLLTQVTVKIDRGSRELVVSARASSPAGAVRLANAFAASLLQFRGAQAVNLANGALALAERTLAALPQRPAARRVALAGLSRQLSPIIAQKQVQVVQPPSADSQPVLVAVIAAALALVGLLILLVAMGVQRARSGAA